MSAFIFCGVVIVLLALSIGALFAANDPVPEPLSILGALIPSPDDFAIAREFGRDPEATVAQAVEEARQAGYTSWCCADEARIAREQAAELIERTDLPALERLTAYQVYVRVARFWSRLADALQSERCAA